MKRTLFILFLFLYGCGNASDIRKPAVAGQFYPCDTCELTGVVDGYMNGCEPADVKGAPVAILVPHAGYVYSARTAAHAFKLLEGMDIETVILVGNSHNFRLDKGAVYASGSFNTPLGNVAINQKLANKLLENTALFEDNPRAHGPEHSLEVELPFLQRALKDFTIVPVLFSEAGLKRCEEYGRAMARAVKELGIARKTVIVISSDMSHYPSWANANMVDGAALKALESFDPELLKKTIKGCMSSSVPNLACVFCGEESLYAAMYASKELGATKAKVLKYTNSAEASGDKSRVVGYGAAVFLDETRTAERPARKGPGKRIPEGVKMSDFKVSEKNQKELLKLARESISHYLDKGKFLDYKTKDPELLAPGAVFVTLTQNGALRGCIGTTEARSPLYRAVLELAVAAAVDDYRFNKLTPRELERTRIEISVLSPMSRTRSADDIKQNVHGVVVRKGGRGGLFLPQVWEHFSRKEDFLGELCSQKAGLSRDAWKDPSVELYIFTVFAFEEK
ncbi:MAG: AmmeMemoRadiSam system protein B [Endomicrobiales bacterium]|nr:AmmeMemoRadiSam system protein B [Endomicrobiales bacterium]